MANSVWGKWAQNPSTQCSLNMCSTLKEYHDKLLTGCVKRVSLISENLMQVELKNDRMIDGENRERNNNRSGLDGRNTIVGAFVTAAARDLMYCRYLLKLRPEQLLYTDTDSVIVYVNKKNPLHIDLPTSDMLGDLKDEYAEMLNENPNWYVHEFMAFGQKMYQLVLRDMNTNEIVHWDKTMKGISMKGVITKMSFRQRAYQSVGNLSLTIVRYCNMVQVIGMIT